MLSCRTVTLNFTNRVWYVDNTNVGTADGRSNTPFATLAAAQTASAAGEIISQALLELLHPHSSR